MTMRFENLQTQQVEYNHMCLTYSYFATDASGKECIIELIVRDSYRLSRFINLENEILFDIGANNGLATILLAKQNPKSQIVAVEPLSELCDVIRKNVKDNHLENVVVLQCALHSHSNGTQLHIATTCSGASSTNVTDSAKFQQLERDADVRDVGTLTYDELCERYNLTQKSPKLLKIDCEGGEYSLFGSKYFRQNGVDYLEGEFHDTAYNASNEYSAQRLFDFCKNYIKHEMQVTVLLRIIGKTQEHTLYYKNETITN